MTTLDSLHGCPYCIDEFQPVGQHPILAAAINIPTDTARQQNEDPSR